MRFSVLASGSSGNALYLESLKTQLLVDGGLTGRELEKRLTSIGVDPSRLHGILITHEHIDHISGVGPFARRFGLPVYIHPDALSASKARLGKLPAVIPIDDSAFEVGDLRVHPFPVPHDAVNPLGFTFHRDGKKLGLATDMGYAQTLVRERLRGCNALILESNHDLEMLKGGPYPWPLKQRIMGRLGHLSNEDAGILLRGLIHERLECVVLAHLSEVNNLPDIACRTARRIIREAGRRIRLLAAGRDRAGDLIEVRGSGSRL